MISQKATSIQKEQQEQSQKSMSKEIETLIESPSIRKTASCIGEKLDQMQVLIL